MKIKYAFQAVVLLALLLVMLILPAYAIAKDQNLEKQLNHLVRTLEEKRIEHHIPGMAIAVVKDDEIILTHGFGQMNLETLTPVNSKTLFAIGSTTKAFTATLIGMLVDEGSMQWDDQVSQYLPYYQFTQEQQPVPITLRDMLSHRTGYTRNDLLWANGQASRELILKTATQAEPWDDYKTGFNYNNVMYLAAGEAAAKQAAMNWDQLLEQRILKPLAMNHTTSIHQVATSQDNIAVGYMWDDTTKQFEILPRRNINNIAPAGGIYSNVEDMAQWLRFHLNQGQVKQQQLITAETLAVTQQPQTNIANQINYGMGWFLRQWQGQPVIEHGGSIDGYAAQVALLPESNLGFILLANVSATPLQQSSMNVVWEHLVKPIKTEDTETQTLQTPITSYDQYVGEYHANFASFKDAIFTFLIKEDGKPAVDVPGQMIYELKQPDADGRWFFAMTDTVAVSFDRDETNQITAMRMHQNRMDFELPKKGVPIQAEIDTDKLQPFLGKYKSDVFKGTIDVIIQNHRLTIDVPNQMAFELHLPDEHGFRQFRIKDDMSAKFERDDNGTIKHLVLYRNHEKVVDTAPRISGENLKPLPSVADIMLLRKTKQRQQALNDGAGYQLTGTVNLLNSGITGEITTLFDAKMGFQQHMDFGIFGDVFITANEQSAAEWGINPYHQFHGKYLTQIRREHPASNQDWRDFYDEVKVINESQLDDKKVYVLRLNKAQLPTATLLIDAENGDVLQQKTKIMNPIHGSIGISVRFENYQEHHGLRMPFKAIIHNPMSGETVIEYTSLKNQQKFDQQTFSTQMPH